MRALARDPWLLALGIGFVVMVVVNVGFAVIAVRGADPVAASYEAERR